MTGCVRIHDRNPYLEDHVGPTERSPNEQFMVSLPTYVIEPPDILLIDAVKVIPKSPYKLEPLDVLQIRVLNTLPDQPIDGPFRIEADGTVHLGAGYGSVKVVGLSVEGAKARIIAKLREGLSDPQISISLAATAGTQRISGEHLVTPDGTVNLGTYGSVYVTGLTLDEARAAIEDHLKDYLEGPKVTVSVFAYNSKAYYIITEGSGTGDQVVRQPITGRETVLDAISALGGLSSISNNQIWIARPAPDHVGFEQRLPVDWHGITTRGERATNYQILPGDRIVIGGSKLVALDSKIAKITAPIERLSGFILLGTSAIRNLNGSFRSNRNNNQF
jgi:polysaccharide export outer membrane protein